MGVETEASKRRKRPVCKRDWFGTRGGQGLKPSPIEGLPLVSAVLSVKPVLLHTWATWVALQPCAYPSFSHTGPDMVLPVPHVIFLATDLFPHPQATGQSPQTDILQNTATHSTV